MEYILFVLIGYLLGGINPAYIIAKLKGFDIRTRGSGNAGASNAVITMGKKTGIFSALFDILKAFVAVKLAVRLFPLSPWIGEATGVACILGHMFPVFMRFRGGKGLACLGGVVLALDWRVFLGLLASELVLALLVDYICVVPITASVVFPIVWGIMKRSLGGALILSVASVAMIARHVENLKRIKNGTEAHLSFLWNREHEIERLQENFNEKE